MLTAEHPSREELDAFGRGTLDPTHVAAIEEHVADCESCCNLLMEQPVDSFVGRLRIAEPIVGDVTTDGGKRTATDPSSGKVTQIASIPRELRDHPRYEVLALIGQGGMGAVYKAIHRRMDRLVALKVIHPDLLRHPSALERFQQEGRAAGRLHHPNIVTSYDADEAASLHFLVMEFLEGRSLAQIVEEEGPLPTARACDFIRQAALGLEHIHDRQMAHRDIKPQNLMLVQGSVVKILDCGLARFAHNDEEAPALAGGGTNPLLTAAGTIMGTADYIAPEQAADARQADIRSDIYALGCTLFFLLTGRTVFPNGSAQEKIAAHAAGNLPSLSELRPQTPPGLEAVLRRMTAKDPRDRYQTPKEVANALASFCNAPAAPAQEAADDAVRIARQPVRKSRRLRLALAVSLAVALVALAYFFLPPVQDFAHYVMRVAANKGVLEIEADDEDIEITIKQEGKQPIVAVINKKTKQSFELTAMGGQIIAKDTTNGTRFKASEFVLERGGRQILLARIPPPEKNATQGDERGSGFLPLFNGKGLDAWTSRADKYFVRKDGVLLANPVDNEYGMLHTKKSYENYELRLECKVAGAGDGGSKARAGLALHVTNVDAGETDLRHRLAITLMGGRLQDIIVGKLGDVGAVNMFEKTKGPTDGWNAFRIIVQNERVTIFLNGEERWSCSRLEGKGRIGLWAVGGDAFFRNIEIKELPASPAAASILTPLFSDDGFAGLDGDIEHWRWVKEVVVKVGERGPRPGEGVRVLRAAGLPTKQPVRLWTRETFTDFELEFETRLSPKGDLGVLIRGKKENFAKKSDMVGMHVRFEEGVPKQWGQVDQLERAGWRRIWTARASEAEKAVKADDWNRVRMRCVSKRLTVEVNGVVTLDETIDKLPKAGAIGFRCMGEAEFGFRNITLRRLAAVPMSLFSDDELAGLDGDLKQWKWERVVEPKPGQGLRVLRATLPGTIDVARLWTTETFSDFELEFEARVPPKGDLRVLVRGQKENFAKKSDMVGPHVRLDDGQPKQWGQIDELEAGGWRRVWVNRAGEAEKAVKPDDWNHVRIRCVGSRLIVEVNGIVTLDKAALDRLPKEGVVGFRCMVAPEFALRNIRLTRLEATALKEITTHEAAFQRLFNGKDFTGWVLEGFPKTRSVNEVWPIEDNAVECFQRCGILRTEKSYADYVFQTEFMFPQAEIEGDDSLGKARLELLVHLADPTASKPPYIKVNLHMDGECAMGPATESGLKQVKSRVLGKGLAIKEWHRLMIVAKREVVEVFVNGQPMGKMTDAAPGKGHIALSPTGMPTLYRNIEIKELPPSRGTVILQNPAAFDVLASFYRIEGERREMVKEFQLVKQGKESSFVLDLGDYEVRGMKLGDAETAWQQRLSVTGGDPQLVVFQAEGKAKPEPAAFQPLFDGKTLKNWQGSLKGWSIEGKVLACDDEKLTLLRTTEAFEDFALRFEYRTSDVINVLLHVPLEGTTPVKDRRAKVQFDGGGRGSYGHLDQRGRIEKAFLAFSDEPSASGWHKAHIRCAGGMIEIWLNGRKRGALATEAGNKGAITFFRVSRGFEMRNIEIEDLTKGAEKPSRPLWNGTDFSGWEGEVMDWQVKDGALISLNNIWGAQGGLFSRAEFENFILRFDYWIEPPAKGPAPQLTVLWHDPPPGTSFEKDRTWPTLQLVWNAGAGYGLLDYKGRALESFKGFTDKKAKKFGWTPVEIHCQDGTIEIYSSGELMGKMTAPKGHKGRVAFLASGPDVSLRNVEVKVMSGH